MAETGIVIVNYNGEAYQNDCVRSLYAMDYKDFEIIVVDSGSGDNSIQKLKKEFPEVHVLLQNENVGVAKGNNIGIKYSIFELKTKYTLLLNNDVEVDRGLLESLVERSSGEYVTVPKIYYFEPNDVLWFAGGVLDWKKGSARHLGIHEIDNNQFGEEKIIDYAPTCCMLIPNRIFEKVGYIDENVFMYYDDTDLCVRFLNHGFQMVYVPKAVMWHKVSSSTGGEKSKTATYYMYRNQLYFINKYRDYIGILARTYVVLRSIVKFILSPFRYKNDRYILDAYLDYVQGRMGRKDFAG